MSSTDGVVRGMDVGTPANRSPFSRQAPRSAGSSTSSASRSMKARDSEDAEAWPIHRGSPAIRRSRAETQVFETVSKGHRPDRGPFVKGGKSDLFGGGRVGKTVVIQELTTQRSPRHTAEVGLLRRRQRTREGNDLYLEFKKRASRERAADLTAR